MRDPDIDIVYKPTRPEFAIEMVKATSTRSGYHETTYLVTSRTAIDQSGWKCLDACGLLGIGQAFRLQSTMTIVDAVPAVNVNRRTGLVVPGVPEDYFGKPITNRVEYTYHQYTIVRICDSGD